MENSQNPNTTVTPAQMKYMLKHKLASLLTQQQLKEKEQRKLAEQNRSIVINDKEDDVHPLLDSAV